MSIAPLRRDQGKPNEARNILAPSSTASPKALALLTWRRPRRCLTKWVY